MTRAVRPLVFAALFGLLPGLCVLSSAATASAQKRVAVSRIDGKGGQLVRAAAQRALKERSEVVLVPGDEVTRAAGRLGVGVDSGKGEISSELGIAAWIEGEVEKDGKRVAITLQVVNGADGETLGVMSYTGEEPEAARAHGREQPVEGPRRSDRAGDRASSAAWRRGRARRAAARGRARTGARAGAPSARARAAEEEEEQQAEAEPAQENEAEEDGDRPSPFDVTLAMAAFSRSFEYNDDLSQPAHVRPRARADGHAQAALVSGGALQRQRDGAHRHRAARRVRVRHRLGARRHVVPDLVAARSARACACGCRSPATRRAWCSATRARPSRSTRPRRTAPRSCPGIPKVSYSLPAARRSSCASRSATASRSARPAPTCRCSRPARSRSRRGFRAPRARGSRAS